MLFGSYTSRQYELTKRDDGTNAVDARLPTTLLLLVIERVCGYEQSCSRSEMLALQCFVATGVCFVHVSTCRLCIVLRSEALNGICGGSLEPENMLRVC